METTLKTKSHLDGAMKRNLFLLTVCQAIGQSANTMMFTATALSVVTFFPNRSLATLPVTMQHLGVMLWVFPAALLMQRMGRRFGFRVGSVFGMTGALTCGSGLYLMNFPLMCLGGLILGYAVASLQMYRFAAVELVPAEYRARAISWVTAGGVVAGIIGPAVADWSYDKLMPFYFGTYLSMIAVHITVFTVMSFIKFPPMQAAASSTGAEPARPLWEIASQPRYAASVIAAMIAFGTMSFLMSASPLAIVGCGLSHAEAHWVIFLHVMGMFVPSFFTGNLISRFGVLNIMFLGAAILLVGVAAALMGLSEWNFRISLMMNGVGWNFLFVGATTLVTTCYRQSERAKAQALNDFLVFGTTATASFLAGFLQERLGWLPLNQASIGLILVAVFAVAWLWLQQRQAALAPKLA
ncbi:MAG TPA: MFS transporter [Acetobacteraceae bacterium]|jgi:MFS family permease|nr:MFS transporter [Acetobacteraceae bacterium]